MIILASKSAIRQQLLAAAGVSFISARSPVDETALHQELKQRAPREMAIALASAKARAFIPQHAEDVIIGVDQTFDVDGEILHKPKNKEQAKQHLLTLNGKTHNLHTAYAIVRNHQQVAAHYATSILTMRMMSEDFIEHYLGSIPESILTSVGCYQLEGLGIQLMQEIKGDYFNILGLPLLPLLADLRMMGELA